MAMQHSWLNGAAELKHFIPRKDEKNGKNSKKGGRSDSKQQQGSSRKNKNKSEKRANKAEDTQVVATMKEFNEYDKKKSTKAIETIISNGEVTFDDDQLVKILMHAITIHIGWEKPVVAYTAKLNNQEVQEALNEFVKDEERTAIKKSMKEAKAKFDKKGTSANARKVEAVLKIIQKYNDLVVGDHDDALEEVLVYAYRIEGGGWEKAVKGYAAMFKLETIKKALEGL